MNIVPRGPHSCHPIGRSWVRVLSGSWQTYLHFCYLTQIIKIASYTQDLFGTTE
jgi:hypothetical protein